MLSEYRKSIIKDIANKPGDTIHRVYKELLKEMIGHYEVLEYRLKTSNPTISEVLAKHPEVKKFIDSNKRIWKISGTQFKGPYGMSMGANSYAAEMFSINGLRPIETHKINVTQYALVKPDDTLSYYPDKFSAKADSEKFGYPLVELSGSYYRDELFQPSPLGCTFDDSVVTKAYAEESHCHKKSVSDTEPKIEMTYEDRLMSGSL